MLTIWALKRPELVADSKVHGRNIQLLVLGAGTSWAPCDATCRRWTEVIFRGPASLSLTWECLGLALCAVLVGLGLHSAPSRRPFSPVGQGSAGSSRAGSPGDFSCSMRNGVPGNECCSWRGALRPWEEPLGAAEGTMWSLVSYRHDMDSREHLTLCPCLGTELIF